jgi:hypothetical protein
VLADEFRLMLPDANSCPSIYIFAPTLRKIAVHKCQFQSLWLKLASSTLVQSPVMRIKLLLVSARNHELLAATHHSYHPFHRTQ